MGGKALDCELPLLGRETQKICVREACEQFGECIADSGTRSLGILRAIDRANCFDNSIHDIVDRASGKQCRIERAAGLDPLP